MTKIQSAVAEYFAAVRALDVERWVRTFASDGVSHDPVGTPPLVGHEALRGFLTQILSLVEKINLTENHVYVNGNSAAVQWIGFVDTHEGKRIDFDGIDVLDCDEEGKITLVRAFWDPTPVFAALNG